MPNEEEHNYNDILMIEALDKLLGELSYSFIFNNNKTNFPYGVISYSQELDLNTKNTEGHYIFLQLDLYSNKPSQLEVRKMINELKQVIKYNNDRLLLSNDHLCYIKVGSTKILKDDSTNTSLWHGVVEIELNKYN